MNKTLVIDNFGGSMTRYIDGDINSGFSNVFETFCNDPFSKPGNLTWNQSPVQIDPDADVITDCILDGEERVENGILYVYAIGHTGRLYKIQVNDPVTFNPNYDNPVLLATLAINSPTFTRGGFIEFFGATEQIFIGHDQGVTRINFDGTSEAFVGVPASWTENVPRPLQQFLGKLYAGNGANLAEIDSTITVTSYAKLTPGFPTSSQVRDIDVDPDGTYLQTVVSRLALEDITTGTQNTTYVANAGSYIFKWNGTDQGYTSYNTFPSFSLSANTMFQNYQYTYGYDLRGGAVFNPTEKLIDQAFQEAPLPPAVSSNGNLMSWMGVIYFVDHLELSYCIFGSLDFEVGRGYWSPFGMLATAPETDVVRTPCQILVSNLGQGASSNGYPSNIFGAAKLYFSTIETSDAPTTKYRFYKWSVVPDGSSTAIIDGVYQTQTQLFSKKVAIKEVRIYGEPWVTNNSFQIDLIGSGLQPISGGTKVFTAGSTLTIGDDFAWYTPKCAPTYAIGLRVTNLGEANHTINKIEIDYTPAGK